MYPQPVSRFNEAPAFLPGKIGSVRGCGDPVRRASMRPRHFCRGRFTASIPGSSPAGCFNEAPAFLPRKTTPLAQWHSWRLQASMRPQHFCRGRCHHCGAERHAKQRSFNEAPAFPLGKISSEKNVITFVSDASMTPRHFCRGRCGLGYDLFWPVFLLQ